MPSVRSFTSFRLLFTALILIGALTRAGAAPLDDGWRNPPNQARVRAYWWWLNGNVTEESITRDLEEMKAKGWGGATIMDAGGADQRGNAQVPHGPDFASPRWVALYQHALREADRLGLELSLNIQSGWNLGGPTVKPTDAVKRLVWSETEIAGPGEATVKLPQPEHDPAYFHDEYVLAYPMRAGGDPTAHLKNWRLKALLEPPSFNGPNAWFLTNSAPPTGALLEDAPSSPGEAACQPGEVADVTRFMAADGTLTWTPPHAGRWRVLRFASTLGKQNQVSTNSQGGGGYALDPLDAGAFGRYWDAVVKPLLDAAGPLAGTTLRYLHTDSWEIDDFNWTPSLVAEFRARCGYDPVPWLPALAGRIVGSRDLSNRFLFDYRKTLGQLAIDHHYKLMKERAAAYGIGIHPESGGPHYTTIDAQECLGLGDVPMSEFWARSTTHRVDDEVRFFVKQPASAAHTNGRRYVAAEGFTTVGPQWQTTIWDNLKPSFDRAVTEGLNRLVWHAFVSSPKTEGVPGQQYFAGTHMNPNVTWWSRSGPFIAYLNRVQWMMQQGLPVADVVYYYGDHVPNYTQLRASDPAGLGFGYDYDVISERALLDRLSFKDGRLVLPDGVSYRMLVLPPFEGISREAMEKIDKLAKQGATIVGAKPLHASGMIGYPESEQEVKKLASALWDGGIASGRIIAGKTGREALAALGIAPDFEFSATAGPKPDIQYIHRRDGETEIYFVASRSPQAARIQASFRVAGKAPEIWDPVSGATRFAASYEQSAGRTSLPLDLESYGSLIVVFRAPAADHPAIAGATSNSVAFAPRQTLEGAWQVAFDPKWGGPSEADFPQLVSWTDRPEPGVKFYSGTATYKKSFILPEEMAGRPLALELGAVHELAEVRLNGKDLGIVWCPPWRVNLGDAARAGENRLEIDVVNFWPNRIIGDASMPPGQRFTKTNIRQLTARTPLMPSGLMGPVRIVEREVD